MKITLANNCYLRCAVLLIAVLWGYKLSTP
jgi:hypothetical protein